MIRPASPTAVGAPNRSSLALKPTIAILLASTALGIVSARAVDATWVGGNVGDPNEWTEPANWTGGNVPDGTATLSTSGVTSIDSNGGINIGGIQFSAAPNAPPYTINALDLFLVNGTGVFNNSTNTQTFNVTTAALFQNSSTASGGSKAVTYVNTGGMFFQGMSSAGTAVITNNSSLQFSSGSTAGAATITNNVVADFFDSSDAGTANITNASGASLTFHDASKAGGATIVNSGDVFFVNSSTAGSSHITNATGSTLTFGESGTAGGAQINTTGTGTAITFNDTSSAGNATFTANASTFGTITFNNTSTAFNAHVDLVDTNLVFNNSTTAGNAIITMSNVPHPGNITFNDTSSAGNSSITNVAVPTLGSSVRFLDASTAANATIINNPNASVPGEGGVLQFGTLGGTDTPNAGVATIINNQFGSTSFLAHATAMNASLTNNSGSTNFQDQSTAGSATIVNNSGGTTSFGVPTVGTDTATAGNAAITNNSGGTTTFAAATTAGSATITTNGGGTVSFVDTSTGGNARFITNAGGTFDMSGLTSGGMTAGSIEGAGNYFLGSKKLTVGSNNLSTTVSGVISDGGTGGGAGGSLVKVGNGMMILTGTNTYTGGTTISAGTLQLGSDGATGSIVGDVLNNGTLVFNRSDAADIFNGTISGSGALNQMGTGTTTLTAADTYSGLTTISAGTLALTGAGSIANSSGVVANSIFDISGVTAASTSIQTLSGSGSVALGTKTLTLTNASGNFSGSIGGSGGIALTGGTQTLSNVNGYTGATTITAGTLSLAGAGSIASSSGVVVNGAFDISGVAGSGTPITTLSGSGSVGLGAKTLTLTNASGNFAGAIGGSGGVAMTSGTQTLSGVNTYTGATTITAGTLALAGAGSIASSSGVVANGAFDISGVAGAGTSIQTLSGSGSVGLGAKTLTLTNASGNFAGAIGGSGGIALTGGTQTLSGANTYTGATTINAGKLSVNGSITSAVTVNNGGTLGGNGTVGPVTVNNGGNLSPGNSIGTININGNLILGAGSVYTVEVSPSAADRTNVTGTASLNGTFNAIFGPGAYNSNSYTVLTTTGGLSGTFSAFTTTGLPAILSASLSYTPTDVMLVTLTSQVAPVVSTLTGSTPNQRAVARAQDAAFNGGLPNIGALYNLALAQLPGALDQLSGEVHPTTAGVLVDESLYARSAILGRLRQASYGGNTRMASLATGGPQAFAGGEEMNTALAYAKSPIVTKAPPMAQAMSSDTVYWAQGFGARGRFDGDGNAATVNRDLAGFFTGVDTSVGGDDRVGIAAGYTGSRNTLDGRGTSTVDTGHIAGYGGWNFGAVNLRAGGDYAFHTIDTSRTVFFPGFFDTDTAHYNGGTAQIFGEAGYGFTLGRVAVEPFAGGAWVHLHADAFSERGGAAALNGAANEIEVGYSTLGIRAATMIPIAADMMLIPRASAAWQHAFDSVTPTGTMAFQAAGVPFVIAGVPIARDAALAEAGLDLAIGRNATIGISYTGQIANNVQDHAAKGKFSWKF